MPAEVSAKTGGDVALAGVAAVGEEGGASELRGQPFLTSRISPETSFEQ
jgi:hypothetical protein